LSPLRVAIENSRPSSYGWFLRERNCLRLRQQSTS